MIVTASIAEQVRFKELFKLVGCPQEITYYKASDTMGVASKKRVCIAIGAAHKPANAFDAITASRRDSDVLKEEAMHCDTWQAWSRVKDPNGQVASVVFALGCNERDCRNIVTWGQGREVCITKNKRGLPTSIDISCREDIEPPVVLQSDSFEKALLAAGEWKHTKVCVKEASPAPLINYSISGSGHDSLHVNSDSSFLMLFSNRKDAYGEQGGDGRYFRVSGQMSETLLANHANGKITIGAYCLNVDNTVRWLCFDIDAHKSEKDTPETIKEKQMLADSDVQRMCAFFDKHDIPYLLEASGTPHSYHVWVLLKQIKAHVARKFGQAILRELDIDCELFPKQNSIGRKGYGNLVKLPFAVNLKNKRKSQVFYRGEWIGHVPEDGMEVGVLDISYFEAYAEECRKKQNTHRKARRRKLKQLQKEGKIRPCIEKALGKELNGERGHWMRIAVTREYHNLLGYSDEEIAELFETQSDYDFEYSLEKVQSITCKEMNPWRCDTIREKCGGLVDCFGCRYYHL
jgi:hypothetical protein